MPETYQRDNHQERRAAAARRPTQSRAEPVPFNTLTGPQQRLVLALLRAHEAANEAAAERSTE